MLAATYIINLNASRDRWKSMQILLDRMGVPNRVRFEAIDGFALDADGLHMLRRNGRLSSACEGFDTRCMAGEIGCALSHAGVMADVVEKQLPSALILEDDIALDGPAALWPARFQAAFADLPPDWELWYLYRCFDIRHRIQRLTPRTVVPWTPQGGAAYAVTLAGARKLLAALTPVRSAVDRVYAELVRTRAIRAYAASPMLVQPGTQPSIINRDNPSKTWVEDGVNRPPEYWPDMYLAHLGEEIPRPAWHGKVWQTLSGGLRKITAARRTS